MNHLIILLIISFLLQTIGYYSLKKEFKKVGIDGHTKAIKVGMSAIIWGIAMQLFIIIAFLFF